MSRPPRRCLGYGPTEGKCTAPAGSSHSDHWCQACDDVRRATITKQLEDLVASFGPRP